MSEKLKLNSIFGNGMVLQRDTNLNIFGEANDGDVITIEFNDKKLSTVVKNSRWNIELGSFKSGGPYKMKISNGFKEIVIADILIGDVYIAGGQSNMEFTLKESLDGYLEIKKSNYLNIRYYNVPRIEYEDEKTRIPNLDDGKWEVCTPKSSKDFSAIAYYFAKEINKDMDIPIGIIGCNKGGTSASCWMSEEYLSKNKEIKEVYLDKYLNEIKELTLEEENKNLNIYEEILSDYNKKVLEYSRKYPERSRKQLKKDLGYTPWPPPIGRKSFLRPCGLYETMLKKIVGFKVKAALWYQGEEDTQYAYLYEDLLSLLIENWRKILEIKNMPFICVQLPGFNDIAEKNWPLLRVAQLNVSEKMDNVEIVISIDCGEEFNVHPVEKETIGKRIALIVKEKIYGMDIEGHSPKLIKSEVSDKNIVISFESNVITKDHNKVFGVEASIDGEKYFKIDACVENEKIIISNNKDVKYKCIRYGWANYPIVNLYGINGLPVSPFKIYL